MKKLLFLGFLLFLLPASASAKSWSFSSWDAAITVNPDSSILVRETQTFSFSGEFTYVTRTLPESEGILYDDIRVFDADGKELTGSDVDISNHQTSAVITIHFAAKDTERTWTIQYRAWNALGYFADHDELYWNAVSIDRPVPISSATVRVTLPSSSIKTEDVQQRLLVGPVGSTMESTNYSIDPDGTLVYHASDIGANESMTIVAGWPKGYVTPIARSVHQTPLQRFWAWFRWVYFASPILLFFILFRLWYVRGRDPKGRGAIVPQYDPPDNIRPGVMGVLINEKANLKDITATIVDLAVRGYLRIHETEEQGFLKKKTAYSLERLDKPKKRGDALSAYEATLLDDLFDGETTVQLDDLKNVFYKKIKPLNALLMDEASSKGYFEANPESVRQRYIIFGSGLIFLGFFTLFVPVVWGVLIILFGLVMPKRSAKGVAALEWAKGFKVYLHTAERFRLQNQKPEEFERLLPYAMIFGVEKEWAGRFVDIYKEPPDWYSGSMAQGFVITSFASHLQSSFAGTLGQTLASNPSQSSGFGGGGFSGGGGGGGGSGAG